MDGMDMDGMDMGSSSTMTGMVNYLHFSPTSDPLWFKEWAPSSSGAMVGACIGLFIFAIIERLLHGIGGIMEAWWHKRAAGALQRKYSSSSRRTSASASSIEKIGASSTDTESASISLPTIRRILPPFILTHELSRAALRVARNFMGFALMLAVMTFNASYIISILAGAFAGELLFGRFVVSADHA